MSAHAASRGRSRSSPMFENVASIVAAAVSRSSCRRLVELRQEHRVGEVLPAALASDERQVCLAQVARPPAKGQRVERDDDRAVPRLLGSRARSSHRSRGRSPSRAGTSAGIRLGDLLDRMRRRTRDEHRHPRRGCRLADATSRAPRSDREHPDRREQKRRRRMQPEHVDRDVARGVAREHPRPNPPPRRTRRGSRASSTRRPRRRRCSRTRRCRASPRRRVPSPPPDRPLRRLLRDVDRVLDTRAREAHRPILDRCDEVKPDRAACPRCRGRPAPRPSPTCRRPSHAARRQTRPR